MSIMRACFSRSILSVFEYNFQSSFNKLFSANWLIFVATTILKPIKPYFEKNINLISLRQGYRQFILSQAFHTVLFLTLRRVLSWKGKCFSVTVQT